MGCASSSDTKTADSVKKQEVNLAPAESGQAKQQQSSAPPPLDLNQIEIEESSNNKNILNPGRTKLENLLKMNQDLTLRQVEEEIEIFNQILIKIENH